MTDFERIKQLEFDNEKKNQKIRMLEYEIRTKDDDLDRLEEKIQKMQAEIDDKENRCPNKPKKIDDTMNLLQDELEPLKEGHSQGSYFDDSFTSVSTGLLAHKPSPSKVKINYKQDLQNKAKEMEILEETVIKLQSELSKEYETNIEICEENKAISHQLCILQNANTL